MFDMVYSLKISKCEYSHFKVVWNSRTSRAFYKHQNLFSIQLYLKKKNKQKNSQFWTLQLSHLAACLCSPLVISHSLRISLCCAHFAWISESVVRVTFLLHRTDCYLFAHVSFHSETFWNIVFWGGFPHFPFHLSLPDDVMYLYLNNLFI